MRPQTPLLYAAALFGTFAVASTASGENCTRCEQGEAQPWICAATENRGVCLRDGNVCLTMRGLCETSEHTLDGMAAGPITGDLLEDLPSDLASIAAALPADGPVRLEHNDRVSTLRRTCDGAVLALAFEPGAEDAFLHATANLVI